MTDSTGKVSQRRKAYEAIRNMIIQQEIRPGYPIWETDIAELLGMSRTPVREALQRLRSDGLVYHIKNRGLFVKDLTGEEVEQNYQLTEAVESMIAYLLAQKRDEACIKALEESTDKMEMFLDDAHTDEWAESDTRFHDMMLDFCDNKCLVDIQNRTNILIKNVRIRYTRLSLDRKASTMQHRSLLEAIRSGDAEKARRVWQEHLSGVSKEIKRLLL